MLKKLIIKNRSYRRFDENVFISEEIFKELILRQRIFILTEKMEEVGNDRTITDELERLSKIAYYKTETEKLLDYIRKLN